MIDDGTCLVSVVVHSDGADERLASTLDSLARQTLPDVEVIVSDADPTGPGTATARRNAAVASARGAHVLELRAGDEIWPELLEECVWALETRPRAGLVTVSGADPGIRVIRTRAWIEAGRFDEQAPDEAVDEDLRIRMAGCGWTAFAIEGHTARGLGAPTGPAAEPTPPAGEAGQWLEQRYGASQLSAQVTSPPRPTWSAAVGRIPVLGPLSRRLRRKLRREGVTDRRSAVRHPFDTALRLMPGRLKGERWVRWGLPVRRDMWNEVPVLRDTPAALRPMVESMRRATPDERVRVLVLHPQLIAGGAEAVLLNLLAHVDRSRFEMHLITTESTPGSSTQNPWLPRFAAHARSVHTLPSFLEREYFLRFIIDFIESNHIDVLLVSLVPYGYHALAEIKRACPRLAVVDLLHAEAPYIPMDSVRLSTMYRSLIDRRVVISEPLRSLLIDKYGESPDRVSVIPNFVDTEGAFDPANHPPGALKREVGLTDATSVVLFFGRLAMEKQPLHIVEVADLMRQRPDVAFVLLGDGPERRKVEDEVARRGLGNVFIRPAREAVADALADAKLTICPSKLEGVPMAGIESLAMGKPVVAARVPGWIEMITDGQDGFLIEDGDFPGYVRAIEALLDDPALYARMSCAARRGAVARFSVPECLSLWQDLFADAAAGPRT